MSIGSKLPKDKGILTIQSVNPQFLCKLSEQSGTKISIDN